MKRPAGDFRKRRRQAHSRNDLMAAGCRARNRQTGIVEKSKLSF
jgi:hypothetical protein